MTAAVIALTLITLSALITTVIVCACIVSGRSSHEEG